MKRYPDGVDGPFFYEKSCPTHRPTWIKTAPVFSKTREAAIHYCVLDDLPSLVWAANLADLEMHTYLSLAKDPSTPTSMVFDLDPGPGTDIIDCCDVALALREMMEGIGLRSLAKTSGSKGLQLHVPLNTPAGFDDTKALARALGELLERERPDKVTAVMSKAQRTGKVFIDWSQNDTHKTTVTVYSLRARPTPTVSTPVHWNEVEAGSRHRDATELTFEADDVLARIRKHGDLYADLLDEQQSLPVLL